MGWMVIEHLNDHVDRKTLPNIEWGPGAAEAMIARVRGFPIPSGDALTMGDLIDVTPRELISQVALEGKVKLREPSCCFRWANIFFLML